jgi:hypothetical protein
MCFVAHSQCGVVRTGDGGFGKKTRRKKQAFHKRKGGGERRRKNISFFFSFEFIFNFFLIFDYLYNTTMHYHKYKKDIVTRWLFRVYW